MPLNIKERKIVIDLYTETLRTEREMSDLNSWVAAAYYSHAADGMRQIGWKLGLQNQMIAIAKKHERILKKIRK